LLTGLLMSFYRGTPGLLLLAVLLGPWLAHTFAVTYYRPRFIYYLFPFLCLAVALPAGWSLERLQRFVREREFRMTYFGPGAVIAVMVLLLSLQSIFKNVWVSDLSTWSIVTGSNITFAREVPNFRDAAGKVLPIEADAQVVTTDPVLSSYYLLRSDFVFPFILPSQHPRHYNMETPGLTPQDFLDLVDRRKGPLILIGTIRKLEGVLIRTEMDRVKQLLENCSEQWEVEGARVYRWAKRS
jgi:hypothetical protein